MQAETYNDKAWGSSPSRGIWKWKPLSPTGVTELPVDDAKVKIYPNPSAGIVHFTFPKNKRVTEILIYDLQGKVVSRFIPEQGRSPRKSVMDLKNLKKGIYVVEVKMAQGMSRQKLILE